MTPPEATRFPAVPMSAIYQFFFSTTAERAGLFCALAPVSAGFLGWLVLGERLSSRGLLGAALVMTGILIPHFWHEKAGADRVA